LTAGQPLPTYTLSGEILPPEKSAEQLALESRQAVIASGIRNAMDLGETETPSVDALAERVAMLEIKLSLICDTYFRGTDWEALMGAGKVPPTKSA
jgi:hypothetical protein